MRKLVELGAVSEETRANTYLGSQKDGGLRAYDPTINKWVYLKVEPDSMQRDLAPAN